MAKMTYQEYREQRDKVPEGKYLATPYERPDKKIGRNDSCPCGSGKKYKKCCGAI